MKKLLLSLCLSIASLLTIAQVKLTSDEMLPFGSVMTQKSVMDLTVIDTTIQGANSTWNFSALTPNTATSDMVVTISNPANTPNGSAFTNSNYAYREVQGPNTAYRYFALSSSKMERVGSYLSNINIYSDPQVEYIFPLQLGASNNDTWASTNSSFGGTYDLTCIGTGTLVLPGNSYNALMVRVHFIEGFIEFYAYFWYSSDNGAILLTYNTGDGLIIDPYGLYLASLTIDIEENSYLSEINYTNPVTNNFSLHFQTKINSQNSFRILNSQGQEIYKGSMESLAGIKKSLEIDFSSYGAGIYFMNIYSAENPEHQKTIKIIKQ